MLRSLRGFLMIYLLFFRPIRPLVNESSKSHCLKFPPGVISLSRTFCPVPSEFEIAGLDCNALEIFAVTWNILSQINKVLLNYIFAKLDGSNQIKNVVTDKLNFVQLRVDDIAAKITADSTRKCIPFR